MEVKNNYSSNNDPMRRSSKRRNHGGGQEMDRISSLPNPLLHHILSFLPTKHAARTSVLSKAWKSLWTCLPILDFFNDSIEVTDSKKKRFVSFIKQTLILNQSPKMEKFRVELGYKKSYATMVDDWLRFATRRNVEELELNFSNAYYALPMNILGYNSPLVTLKLKNCRIDHHGGRGRINWKSLEVLSLSNMSLSNDLILDILSGSPSLEFLELLSCRDFGVLDIKSERLTKLVINCKINHHGRRGCINWKSLKVLSLSRMSLSNGLILDILLGSPSLEFLELMNCCNFNFLDINSARLTKLVIHDYGISSGRVTVLRISAPYIQSLGIFGFLNTQNISLVNMGSLNDAKLNFFLDNENRKHTKILVMLLKNLHHVKDLTMGTLCLQDLSVLEEKALPCPLSCFVCLRLDTSLGEMELPGITKLLAVTPLLETLVINATCNKSSVSDHFGENFWSSQKSLFALALRNLKTVKIVNFRSMNSEIELICFLLKNASSLAKMIIHAPNKKVSLENSLEFAERLLSIQRCSRDAVVVFS